MTARRTRPLGVVGGLALGLAAVITACSSGEDPEPAAGQAGLLDRGAEVYSASCAACHGEDLRGTDRGPSHLSIVYEPGHHPDDAFRGAITNGAPQHHWAFGPMPPVTGLNEADIEAVIAFIRAEQERQGLQGE